MHANNKDSGSFYVNLGTIFAEIAFGGVFNLKKSGICVNCLILVS